MASAASPPAPPRLWRAPASDWVSWPGSRRQRWASSLLFALPLAALAVWAHSRGLIPPGLHLLEQRADRLRSGGAALSGIGYAYPPVPTLAALVLPGGALSLALAACVCSGVMLTHLAERLLHRVSAAVTVVLLAALAAVPATWYPASQLLPQVGSLALLAVALDGFLRFTAYGQTEGGFAAGIALALAFFFDPGALMYAAVMCGFAPMISHARYRGEPAAARGIAAVLAFPVAAVCLGWLFLVWKFTGGVGSLRYAPGAHLLTFPAGVLGGLAAAARAAALDLAHAPLYLVAGLSLYRRRPVAITGLLLPVLALALALWLGFAYSQVTAFFMFTILALVTIADTAPRRIQPVLIGGAVLQLTLGLAWPPGSAHLSAWLHAIT